MNCILYSGTKNASSWAMRTFLALREAGIPFEEKVVDIRRPQRFRNLAEIGKFAPPAAVPVLVFEDDVIFDSLAIMEFANEVAGGRLLPSSLVQRARARSMMAWQHSGLSSICPRLSFESAFYPDKRALSPEEKKQIAFLFEVWECELQKNKGDFLFGELSLADLNFVPSILRLMRHKVDTQNFPKVAQWTERILALASVREWLAEADLLPPVWYDDYLLPSAICG